MRFTAFINREAAPSDGPWGELLPAVTVPVRARSRAQWVLGEQALLPALAARARVDLVHSLASTAPLWGPLPPRRDRPRPDLRALPRRPSGPARQGHAPARAGGRRGARDRVIADSASTRDGSGRAARHRRVSGSTSSRSGSAPCSASSRLPRAQVRARFALGDRALVLSLSAKRPHKNLARADRRARADPGRSGVPCSCCRATRRGMSRSSSERRARGRREDDVRLPGWVSGRELEGLWAMARRVRASRRCTRASACPCSRRWRAACRSPARTPPRCPRSRATRRCCSTPTTTRAIAAARASGCSTTPAEAERLRARGLRSARAVHVGAHARADARQLRARARAASRSCPGPCAARTRATGARRVVGEPARRAARAARCPPRATRTIASAIASGSEAAAMTPLTPSSISSVAALSGAGDDDARRPLRGGLDDDQAVALAARGQQHAQRAAQRRVDLARRARSPARVIDLCAPARAIALSAARARVRRRRTRRAGPRCGAPRAATPATASGACFSGIIRPANRTTGSAGSAAGLLERAGVLARRAPSPRRAGPPRAGAPRAAREKQKARWGIRAHSR